LYFIPLGWSDLYNKGEPRESLVVWDIVHSGNWLLPMRNRELPSKPPMFHWIAATASMLVGSVSAFTVRIPSAILGLGGVILTFLFGKKIRGQAVGFLSALVLATCFRYAKLATQARVDMTTAFFVAGAIMFFYVFTQKEKDNSLSIVGFYLLVALAVLAKGPLGAVLPFLAVGLYSLLRKNSSLLEKLLDWKGILVFLTVAGGWYAAALMGWGESFLTKQILSENFSALFGNQDSGHRHAIYYYIPQLFVGTLPWGFFLPFMLAWWIRERKGFRAEGDLYILSWFLAVFGFFTIGSQKRGDYLLPLFPVVALWLGEFFWSKIATEGSFRLIRAVVLTGLSSLVLAGLLFFAVSGKGGIEDLTSEFITASSQKDRIALLQIGEYLASRPVVFSLLTGFTLVPWLLSLAAFVRRKLATSFCTLLLGNLFFLGLTFPIGNDIIGKTRSFRPFAEQVRLFVKPGDSLFYHKAWDYSLIFYFQRPIPSFDEDLRSLPGAKRVFVVLPISEWETSSVGVKSGFVELARSKAVGSDGNQPLVLIQRMDRQTGG
jgi:hypothetical protein